MIAETLAIDGVNTTYSAANAVLFDGVIITDGIDSLFKGNTSTSSTFYPPLRPIDIVRDAFFYGKPVGAVGEGGRTALDVAGVPQQDGVFITSAVNGSFIDDFEGGLKQFKYLDRFPLDS